MSRNSFSGRAPPPPRPSVGPGRTTAVASATSPPPPPGTRQYSSSPELRASMERLTATAGKDASANAAKSNVTVAAKDATLYAGNHLSVQSKLHRRFVRNDAALQTNALLTVSTPAEVGKAQPFELVVLLDTSGSMSGEKLVKSKQAIREIIGSLSDQDVLHLVSYSSQASIVFQNGRRAEADRLLTLTEALSATGGTNMSGGLELAFKILAGKTSSRRIFLFSDGEANEGVQSAIELEQVVRFVHANGVNVTSFGVGDRYAEQTMRAIATAGHGDFFDMNTAAMIPSIVKKGIAVLATLVASNLTLQLTPLNGTAIEDIVGYSSTSLAALGDISSDDMRQILVKITIPPRPAAAAATAATADLFYFRLSFVMAGDTAPSFVQGTLACEYSDDPEKLNLVDDDVKVALAIASASETDKEVYDLLASNKFAEARAKKAEAIAALVDVESIDRSGFVKHLVALGRAAHQSMADTRQVEQAKKAVYWTGGGGIVHRKCF